MPDRTNTTQFFVCDDFSEHFPKSSVNMCYWYKGNDIVKLWEAFLRKELKDNLRFLTKEG